MQDFISYVQQVKPELLRLPEGQLHGEQMKNLMHGTTIVGVCYDEGVILAGDRRMTSGTRIARNLADKVLPIDTHAAIAYSGTATTCMHMAEIIRISQNNYRKISGRNLSLEGKAKYVSQIVRQNMAAAFQGLVFLPLLAGYDGDAGRGFIFSFEVIGGYFKNTSFAVDGSGGDIAAQTSLNKWKETGSREEAVKTVLTALQEAAKQDSATSGVHTHIPRVYAIDKNGGSYIDDAVLKAHVPRIMREIGE